MLGNTIEVLMDHSLGNGGEWGKFTVQTEGGFVSRRLTGECSRVQNISSVLNFGIHPSRLLRH